MSGAGEKASFKTVVQSLFAIALVLAGLWGFEFYGSEFEGNSLFGLGLLVLGGIVAGRLCSLIGLPSLTGYLGAGLVFGPSVTGFIPDEQVEQLRLVNSLALALISMHAGCELTKEMLQKNLKSLTHAFWAHITIIGTGITLILVTMKSQIIFLSDLEFYPLLATSIVFATIAISKSPAAVMAILGETNIKNKLSDHALGIVVTLDVIVLMLFPVVFSFAKSSLNPDSLLSFGTLSLVFSEAIASIAAGCFFGILIAAFFKFINKESILFIVAISYGVTALCAYLDYNSLLVFVVAGFIVTNFSSQAKKMVNTIKSLSSVIMIVFFATAGASLHIHDLIEIWQLVIIIFLARAILVWASERVAHQIAGSPQVLKTYGFTPFISQAGLSIGLSMILYERLPDIGPKLATLAISVVTLNEVFGPILFKWGLNRVEKLKDPEETDSVTANASTS